MPLDLAPGQSPTAVASQSQPATVTHEIDILLADAAVDGGGDPALSERLRSAADVALKLAKADASALTVVLTNDDDIRALNRRFRGIDKPTNVLSFADPDMPPEPGEPPYLGDVVLARKTLLREASEQEKRFLDHATHLVVHGVLHLLGYTHDTDDDAAQMEALEIAALARLGLPDPYARTSSLET